MDECQEEGSAGKAAETEPERGWRTLFPARVALRVLHDFGQDEVMTLAAALAFYTLLSFAPLLVLLVWASSSIAPGTQDVMLGEIGRLAGDDAREAAKVVVDSAKSRPELGSIAGYVAIATALVGATTVFAQLQTSLNRIWNVEAHPTNAIWGWLRRRVLSMGVILSAVFVLLVSLFVSSALGLFLESSGLVWDALNQVITAAVFVGLFMVLFRYLPDVHMPWRHAAFGGLVTGILFAAGKALIGVYLAHGNVGGAYGAAGSLVVLLVWVYYSGTVFFFGAELVKGWLAERGERIVPSPHAQVCEPRR
ncbi:MAG: YihY/virulence factor BrkB family protein [Xanthomonadales bacterium]|nr:YihY/virulence factor BrkB family protein [Xanthomonadales bacterium]